MTNDEIEEARERYEAGPDFAKFKFEAGFRHAFATLSAVFEKADKNAALDAACAFLEESGAGAPQVTFIQESVRSDALFWAEIAAPHELEAYVVAGIDRMKGTAFGGRQMKRMAGTIWRRMSPKERAEFQEWIMGAGKDAK